MLKDDVKLALRIKHTRIDDEIDNTIEEARAELIRSGVPEDVVTADGALIRRAVITYCQMILGNDKNMADGFRQSFQYQQDCLRKSTLTAESSEAGDG